MFHEREIWFADVLFREIGLIILVKLCTIFFVFLMLILKKKDLPLPLSWVNFSLIISRGRTEQGEYIVDTFMKCPVCLCLERE